MSFIAAGKATQLGAATTTNSGTNVIVTWPATTDDKGSAVTDYLVEFKKSDLSYASYATTCSLANEPNLVTGRTCTVPMSVFTSTFGLTAGDLIKARVSALNAKGYSVPSSDNVSGATAQTVPTVGPTPSRG